MSEKFINDNTPWKNNQFLDLPFLREMFVDPKTSQRSDIYHTRKNTDQSNKLLEEINKKDTTVDMKPLADILQRQQEEVQPLVNDLIWNQKNAQDLSIQMNDQTNENLSSISGQLAEGAMEVKHVLESILGHEVPKDIPLNVLARKLTFEGKKSLVALAIKGAILPEKLAQAFSPKFLQYLKDGVDSQSAHKTQELLLLTLQAMRENISQAEQKYNIMKSTDPSITFATSDAATSINPERKKNELRRLRDNELWHLGGVVQGQRQKYHQLELQFLSEEEIDLLDVGVYAQNKLLRDLLAEDVINPRIASLLVKNNYVTGKSAKIMTNIFHADHGKYNPLIEMNGIAGLWQNTKANNLMQRTMVDQGRLSLSKQDRALEKQDTSNTFLDNINKAIVYGTKEFIQGFKDTNKNLVAGFDTTNKNLVAGFDTTNENLDHIKSNLFYGFKDTNENIGLVHTQLIRNNEELGISNVYLEHIDDGIGEVVGSLHNLEGYHQQTNMFLYDILQHGQETNALLHTNNSLSEEGNRLSEEGNHLQVITNHNLNNIEQQIIYSRAHLTHVLQAMTGALVGEIQAMTGELQDIKQILAASGQLHYVQTQQNAHIIHELQEQSISLKNINQKLLEPLEIKANEFYQTAMTWLHAKEFLDAISDLQQAIQLQSTHIQAQYALAIAYYQQQSYTNAIKHFQKTRVLALHNKDFSLLSQVSVWLAKISLKQLNISETLVLLDEALIYDPSNIDAQVLKIQIEQLQQQSSKIKVSAHVLFEQLFSKDSTATWYGLVTIDLAPFDTKIKKIVDDAFKGHDAKRLVQVLQKLQAYNYTPYQKEIVTWLLTRNSSLLFHNAIIIDEHIIDPRTVKGVVDTLLQSHSSSCDEYYRIAYIFRRLLKQETINSLLQKGLSCDPLWIQYKDASSRQQKDAIKKSLLHKRYAFGHDAQKFVRPFLDTNPFNEVF